MVGGLFLPCFLEVCSKMARLVCLWLKPKVLLNGFQAVVQGKVLEKDNSFACVPHERQVELAVAHKLHASEFEELVPPSRGVRCSFVFG
jgi:hypothetical protein